MLEGEDHIQLMVFGFCITDGILHPGARPFSNRRPVVMGDGLSIHLFEKLMDPWAVVCIWGSITIFSVYYSIRKTLIFADHGDYIHSEAVDAFVPPESHKVIYSFPYPYILPVKVRLLF